MSDRSLRDSTVRFVADLCEPVGPFTFAGYGGPIAALRQRIYQSCGDDEFAGVFQADARVREIMAEWAASAPLPATIEVLLELFVAPPAEAGRHVSEWRSELTELLYLCGQRDRAALADGLAAGGETLAPLAAELDEWFAEDEPSGP